MVSSWQNPVGPSWCSLLILGDTHTAAGREFKCIPSVGVLIFFKSSWVPCQQSCLCSFLRFWPSFWAQWYLREATVEFHNLLQTLIYTVSVLNFKTLISLLFQNSSGSQFQLCSWVKGGIYLLSKLWIYFFFWQVWTQCLPLARFELYHLSHTHIPFCFSYF
jgi:hypothetical protein